MKILFLEGPNLNCVGTRETRWYGRRSPQEVQRSVGLRAKSLGVEVSFRQTNHEGDLIGWLQEIPADIEGICLNPGGLSHTSVALLDAILACPVPVVEVHYSNLARRESFRQSSLTARGAIGRVEGFGGLGYELALEALFRWVQSEVSHRESESGSPVICQDTIDGE